MLQRRHVRVLAADKGKPDIERAAMSKLDS
jgi:hypothetical protein